MIIIIIIKRSLTRSLIQRAATLNRFDLPTHPVKLYKPSQDVLQFEKRTVCCWRSPRGLPSGFWCVWTRWDQTAGLQSARRPRSAPTWADQSERSSLTHRVRKKKRVESYRAQKTQKTSNLDATYKMYSTWHTQRDNCTEIYCGSINGEAASYLCVEGNTIFLLTVDSDVAKKDLERKMENV